VLAAIVDEVLVAHHRAEPVESSPQEFGIFAALRDAPCDELVAIVHRRRHVESKRRRYVRKRKPRRERADNQAGGAGNELTSLLHRPPESWNSGMN
jgi:hypothetical protein